VRRAIDHAQAAALRLGAVPVSVLGFVPKELGVRAALRMRGYVGCALCAHECDVSPLARAQSDISKMCGRAVWIVLVVFQRDLAVGVHPPAPRGVHSDPFAHLGASDAIDEVFPPRRLNREKVM
jgi:hypothetical protein